MKTGGKCIKYPCFCGFWYALGGGKCRKIGILLAFCTHYYLSISYLRATNRMITCCNSKKITRSSYSNGLFSTIELLIVFLKLRQALL